MGRQFVFPLRYLELLVLTMPSLSNGSIVSIIDIRRGEMNFSVLDEMKNMLRPVSGLEKGMPTMLLYNEKGLNLFEEITYLDEYYLTNAEIDVLEHYAGHIAARIVAGSQLIELGSGYGLIALSRSLRRLALSRECILTSGIRVTDKHSATFAKSPFSYVPSTTLEKKSTTMH